MYRFLVLFSSTIFIIVSLQNAFATLASFVNYDYCEFLLRTWPLSWRKIRMLLYRDEWPCYAAHLPVKHSSTYWCLKVRVSMQPLTVSSHWRLYTFTLSCSLLTRSCSLAAFFISSSPWNTMLITVPSPACLYPSLHLACEQGHSQGLKNSEVRHQLRGFSLFGSEGWGRMLGTRTIRWTTQCKQSTKSKLKEACNHLWEILNHSFF